MRISRYVFLAVALSLFSVSAFAQVYDAYIVPAAGNVAGENGTRWVTDVDVFNPQGYPLAITAVLYRAGGVNGGDSDVKRFTVGANENRPFSNILGNTFGYGGTGAIAFYADPADNPGHDDFLTRAFVVTSNTFNNASSGTFGQIIPGVAPGLEDYQTTGLSAVANGIRHSLVQPTGYRTNVGAVNLGDHSVTLQVRVYDSLGNAVSDWMPFELPPYGYLQQKLPVTVERGTVEFEVDDSLGNALVFPYASVVDNRSGDPQYINPMFLGDAHIVYPKAAARDTVPQRRVNVDTLRRSVAAKTAK